MNDKKNFQNPFGNKNPEGEISVNSLALPDMPDKPVFLLTHRAYGKPGVVNIQNAEKYYLKKETVRTGLIRDRQCSVFCAVIRMNE